MKISEIKKKNSIKKAEKDLGFGFLHDLIDVNKPPEEDIEEIKELEKKKTMKKKGNSHAH